MRASPDRLDSTIGRADITKPEPQQTINLNIGPWRAVLRADLDAHALSESLADPESLFAREGCRLIQQDDRSRLAVVRLPAAKGGPGLPAQALYKRFPSRRLRRGGKSRALSTWNNAWELLRRGVPTPPPLLVLENSDQPWRSPSYLLVELIEPSFTARQFFDAYADGRPPPLPVARESFIEQMGEFFRFMHDQGVWHRDLGSANLLVRTSSGETQAVAKLDFLLVDISRTRFCTRLGRVRRMSDLARMRMAPADRPRFLRAYARSDEQVREFWHWYCVAVRLLRIKKILKRAIRPSRWNRTARRSQWSRGGQGP